MTCRGGERDIAAVAVPDQHDMGELFCLDQPKYIINMNLKIDVI